MLPIKYLFVIVASVSLLQVVLGAPRMAEEDAQPGLPRELNRRQHGTPRRPSSRNYMWMIPGALIAGAIPVAKSAYDYFTRGADIIAKIDANYTSVSRNRVEGSKPTSMKYILRNSKVIPFVSDTTLVGAVDVDVDGTLHDDLTLGFNKSLTSGAVLAFDRDNVDDEPIGVIYPREMGNKSSLFTHDRKKLVDGSDVYVISRTDNGADLARVTYKRQALGSGKVKLDVQYSPAEIAKYNRVSSNAEDLFYAYILSLYFVWQADTKPWFWF